MTAGEVWGIVNGFFETPFENLKTKELDFIHYTSADVFCKIIDNKNIWLRNARDMNDTSELLYGTDKTLKFFKTSSEATAFWKALDEKFPGIPENILKKYDACIDDVKRDTYIFSLSEHDELKHPHGKLSMWRGYGRQSSVALVIDPAFYVHDKIQYHAFCYPVFYEKADDKKIFENYCKSIIDRIGDVPHEFRDAIQFYISDTLKNFSFIMKHEAFFEELEWRTVYRPSEGIKSNIKLEAETETINGLTQTVFKLPFYSDKNSLQNILKKVIIGPTHNQQLVADAVHRKLCQILPRNEAERMIDVSNIPFRG